jgi:alcohol dehydrogenase class IV
LLREEYKSIAQALGEKIEGLSDLDGAGKAITAIRAIMDHVGVSYRLGDYGVSAKDIPAMVTSTMKEELFLLMNPRTIVRQDVKDIYKKSL